jgi:hypothetical protein
LSIRYSVRLLSNSGVAGELRYLGRVRRLATGRTAAQPDRRAVRVADREDHPLAEPVVDAAPPDWRGWARPDLDELVAPDVALRASCRASVSQPPGAKPSWCFAIVSSVKPRPRRYSSAVARPSSRQHRVVEGDRALEDVAEALLAASSRVVRSSSSTPAFAARTLSASGTTGRRASSRS